MGSTDPNKDAPANAIYRCASGHKPQADGTCRYCGKHLEYADGLHVDGGEREKRRVQ